MSNDEISKLDSLDGINTSEQIAKAIIQRIDNAPERFAPIYVAVVDYLKWIIGQNISLLKKVNTESDLADVVTEIADNYIKLGGILEMLDGVAIRFVLNKLAIPVLVKLFGAGWFEKFKVLLTNLESEIKSN